jgi:hypothetical protein
VKRREQRVVIVDPVEGGVREDRVDRLGQIELDQVLAGTVARSPSAAAACSAIDGATSTA